MKNLIVIVLLVWIMYKTYAVYKVINQNTIKVLKASIKWTILCKVFHSFHSIIIPLIGLHESVLTHILWLLQLSLYFVWKKVLLSLFYGFMISVPYLHIYLEVLFPIWNTYNFSEKIYFVIAFNWHET